MCRRGLPAEPSTTKAQRLQGLGTQEELEKVKKSNTGIKKAGGDKRESRYVCSDLLRE